MSAAAGRAGARLSGPACRKRSRPPGTSDAKRLTKGAAGNLNDTGAVERTCKKDAKAQVKQDKANTK